MVSIVFSDYIVNATDLRKNQKRWLEKACQDPVTISYRHKQLAIVNREQIGRLYTEKYWTELVLKACQEFMKGLKSETFPWVEYLSDEEKTQFHTELLTCAMKSTITGDWVQLEQLIQDWEATAETERHPEIVKALQDEETLEEYVSIE